MKSVAIAAPKNQRALTYAVIAALVVGFLFLQNFVSLIIAAMIIAFLFEPVYAKFVKKFKKESTAAALTLLVISFVIIVPLVLIMFVTVNQASIILADLSNFVTQQQYSQVPSRLLISVNDFLTELTGRNIAITQEQVLDRLADYASLIINFVIDSITSWVGSLGSLITNLIIFIYVLSATLIHQNKLAALFKTLNPLGDSVSDLYLDRAEGMTKGMIRGQFIIATIQGVTSAIILTIAGLPYFAFFALILSFMSLIPLGAGIITIPIGIAQILLGNVWQGMVIILGHLLVVTNIDNVLKPILVPKEVRLQPALLILAVFAGLGLFGFLGIFIGPVIMIIIITTIDVYIKYSNNIDNKTIETK